MPGTQDNNQSQQQALEQLRTELARAHRTIEALQRAKRRVGLSFNRIPETGSHIAHLWAGDTPVLDYVPECSLAKEPGAPGYAPDAPATLIEADNWAALSLLQQTHRGRVDVICIDPPYNTGNEDFIYNDARRASMADLGLTGADYELTLDGKARTVGKDDPDRHSSWISFMEPRLWLAKQLLSPAGVVFVSIDDNEQARLKLLMDGIFGEQNTETMVWQKVDDNSGRLKVTKRFRREHEYVLVGYRDISLSTFSKFKMPRNYKNDYDNPDGDPRGAFATGIMSHTEQKSRPGGKNYFSVTTPSGRVVTRQWRVTEQEFAELRADNRIYFGKNGDSVPGLKIFLSEEKLETPTSLLTGLGTAKSAGTALVEILGDESFSYPKPVALIQRLLRIATSHNPSAVVLDFFAGSGTTGQAVAQLNAEDGGTRQCILVTHGDENGKNIAADITAERLKRVLSGENWADGKEHPALPGDLAYYRLGWAPKASNSYSALEALQGRFAGVAALAHDAHERLEKSDEYVVLGNSKRLVVVWQSEDALVNDPEEAFYPLLDRLAATCPDRELLVYTPSTLSAEDDEYDVRSRGWTPVAFPGEYVANHAALVEQMKRNGLLQPPFQGSKGAQDGEPAGEPGDAITGEPGDETGEDL